MPISDCLDNDFSLLVSSCNIYNRFLPCGLFFRPNGENLVKRSITKLLVVCALLLTATSVFAIQLDRCSPQSAYETGKNDAYHHKLNTMNYANTCRSYTVAELNSAYTEGHSHSGYRRNDRYSHKSRKHHEEQCLTNMQDQKVCGYHCVKNNFGDVVCAKHYKENCAMNNFGKIKCGMHCSVNQDTTISCQTESATGG